MGNIDCTGLYRTFRALAELNQLLPMPKDWQQKAKELEESYEKTVMAMAHMPRIVDFILALLTVAVAPAILEELLFRAGLQPIFIGITRSPFWGILITSLLFSAIHFSIYGFISRVALGLLLGLVYYYGRNIWLSILFHFVNNALIVVALFWAGRNGKPATDVINEKVPWVLGLVSFVAIVFLFRLFIKASSPYWRSHPNCLHSTMGRMSEQWVRVYETQNLTEASILKGLLEENGLPVQLLNKQDSAYLLGTAEIYVPKKMLPAAELIIDGNRLN